MPYQLEKSSHQRRTWWRSHLPQSSSTIFYTCSGRLPSSFWSNNASYLLHKRLGLAALCLCGSSWHSQPSYWLMLRVAWLDLHWNFSGGPPESKVLKFCHSLPFEWPSGLGHTHRNAHRHQKRLAWDTLVIFQGRQSCSLHGKITKGWTFGLLHWSMSLPQGQMVTGLDC